MAFTNISLPVSQVQVIAGRGPDHIIITLDSEKSQAIHGDLIKIWGPATLKLECAGGAHKQALAALGIDTYEYLDTESGDKSSFTR